MKLQKFLMCVLVLYAAYSSAAMQRAGVQVSGRFFNVEGEPFNDRNCRAVLRVGNGVAGVSNIGANGAFEFTNISPGDYSLSLSGAGFVLSPVIPVHVANTEVRNIEMIVPRWKQVSGQVAVDGGGPLPQVRLLLKPVKDPIAKPGVKALSPSGFVTNDMAPALVPITPIVNLDLKPDGTFVARIPDGDWNVSFYSELPAGYAIKSLTYGTVDILRSPLKLRLSEDAAVRLVVTNSIVRLSEVYGRITGLNPEIIARGPITVTFRGPMSRTQPAMVSAPRTAVVHADGTFEMKEVLSGDYSLLVTGLDNLALAVARLSVAKTDVRDLEIKISRVEIRGQVVVEGGSPVPALTLGFKKVQERGAVVGGDEIVNVAIRPLRDGTFSALLPEEEPLLNSGYSAPCGYKLKSMIFGATDVLRIPLKVLKADASQLQITLVYAECPKR
jgi:hypothetical protein